MDNFFIQFVPFDGIKEYNVRIDTQSKSIKSSSINTVLFDCKYSFLKNRGNNIFVSIEKSNTSLNNKIILNLFDDVLLNAGKALDKLDLNLNKNGCIEEIINIEEVRKKWEKQRFYIESTYTGSIISEYLDIMQEGIMDDDKFYKVMRNDLFLLFFFTGLYKNEFVLKDKCVENNMYVNKKNKEFFLRNIIGESTIFYKENSILEKKDSGQYVIYSDAYSTKHIGVIESLKLILKKECTSYPFFSSIKKKYILSDSGHIIQAEIKIFAKLGNIYEKGIDIFIYLKN